MLKHEHRFTINIADKFLGDQRSSYNHDLTFKLSIGENSPEPKINDVILEGGSGLRITQAIFGQGNQLPSDTVNIFHCSILTIIHCEIIQYG
jgi:hypothetical protein